MNSYREIEKMFAERHYIADRSVWMTLYLSLRLEKPLLIEGPAGVGKTEAAKVLAKSLDTELIRLQCYEGLEASHALYEWNYQHQLLYLKMHEQSGKAAPAESDIFSDRFLLKRPLLQAIQRDRSPVLLIDEVDRSDEEFESFLLELLSDWQITIPEIGTIRAVHRPHVVLTGNRTRELSEALRRRCLYLWIPYPDFAKELAIVKEKVPGTDRRLAEQICRFMGQLRQLRLDKAPGVSETLDWAQALAAMHVSHLDREMVEDTLGIVLKDWQDIRRVTDSLSELFEKTGITSKVG